MKLTFKLRYIAVCIAILLVSASCKDIYKKIYDLPYAWDENNILVFRPEITNDSLLYDLKLHIRHTQHYSYKNLIISVNTTSPSGKTFEEEFNLQLRNTKGEFAGSGMGDLWDLEIDLYSGVKYNEQGSYTYTIRHAMPQNPVLNLMEIGFEIKESEKK